MRRQEGKEDGKLCAEKQVEGKNDTEDGMLKNNVL